MKGQPKTPAGSSIPHRKVRGKKARTEQGNTTFGDSDDKKSNSSESSQPPIKQRDSSGTTFRGLGIQNTGKFDVRGNLVIGAPEHSRCLADLRSTDSHHDKTRIESSKGGLLKDAYRWILAHDDFIRWRVDPQSHVLWIKGDPGKGKTMLICGIIEEMEKELKSKNKVRLLSFFFCQATDSRIDNATAVLRGLIHQLVDQQSSLISHVRKKYDHAGKRLFEDANAWVALSEIFSNILQDLTLPSTYFIIDALDECQTDLQKLLDLIVKESSVGHRVKWIVSSRNWPVIEESLNRITQKVRLSLELNADSVSAAVNVYIKDKVESLAQMKSYNNETKLAVQDHLSSNGDNTFLWVALVCQELAKPEVTRRSTITRLRAFPPGLNPLYARMLEQIGKSDDADVCKRILAIVSTVYRPTALQELASLDNMIQETSEYIHELQEVVANCGSFLTIRNDTVYFVHQSAKDFLLNKAVDQILPYGIKHEHRAIFSRSLRAMSGTKYRDCYKLLDPGLRIEEIQIPDPDPLGPIRYASVHWADHFCDAGEIHDENYVELSRFFQERYLYWLETLSLIKRLPKGVMSITRLKGFLQDKRRYSELTHLIYDAHRFILQNRWVVENYPLQAYISALLFSPIKSLIRHHFRNEEPAWVIQKPVIELDWDVCLQTLEGHSHGVTSVAFSPDSKLVASGSDDKTVRLWSADTRTYIQMLKGHSRGVTSVAFSPDSKLVASGSGDQTVRLWSADAGTCIQTLEGYSQSLLFDDNQLLITDLGHIKVSQLQGESNGDNFRKSYGVNQTGDWIVRDGHNIIWLPPNYRSLCFAVKLSQIAFGCPLGSVLIMKF